MAENTDRNTDKRLLNLKPAWKKGDPSPNPNGHKLGQKNYVTLYREALIKLAKLKGTEPSELELELISNGILKAKKGDYRFYKDVLDRLLGQASPQAGQTPEMPFYFKVINDNGNPKV